MKLHPNWLADFSLALERYLARLSMGLSEISKMATRRLGRSLCDVRKRRRIKCKSPLSNSVLEGCLISLGGTSLAELTRFIEYSGSAKTMNSWFIKAKESHQPTPLGCNSRCQSGDSLQMILTNSWSLESIATPTMATMK